MVPTQLKQISATELSVTWEDRHISRYTLSRLRRACPCAECKAGREAEQSLLPILKPGEFELRQVEPVGQYALQYVWGDGHRTGIYTYEYLRSLCECEECSLQFT